VINLSRHIEFQLLYHDTVVVPRLGTFKVTYVPSRWIEEEEILLPPYRALSYTHEVDETDTRFIETISASYQISTEEAYIVTLEFTENIQQELNEYGSFELGSIGEFIQEEATGKIKFIPCQAGVASPSLYGLDAIHVHPTKQIVLLTHKQAQKKIVNTDAKHVTININKRLLHYAASIAAAIVLFFAFSTPVSQDVFTQQQDIHSELFLPSSFITEQQDNCIRKENNKMGIKSSKEDVIESIDKENASENPQAENINESPTFSVVICCGVPLRNAETYCKNLNERGIKAVVDNSGKVLRVLVPNFTSREDALTEVRSLRNKSKEFSNAWIMENK